MKKVNIRRDVESRNEIMNGIPKRNKVMIPKTEVIEDAESEDVWEHEVDEKPIYPEKKKKAGRSPKGDVEAV